MGAALSTYSKCSTFGSYLFFFFFAFLSKMTRLLSDGACGVWGLKSGR